MSLPTDADYNIAVQNPSGCFSDPLLSTGQVEVLPVIGLPKARTGNFATVYKITSGGKPWAVRCFTRAVAVDQHERYQAIASHLAVAKLPYCVPFEYERRGIRVGSNWYPIVKMEWATGESLASYVGRHKQSRAKLLELAAAWLEMLSRAGMAHGDLQHGNVLVDQAGRLLLVDYDGMFVPSLAGKLSQEEGHPNYQHPFRGASLFGPELDNFSAWVIFVSILAIAAAPELWDAFQGGDECLLFRRSDFKDSEQSKIFRALSQLPDRRIRLAVACFKSATFCRPEQVPPLTEQFGGAPLGDPSHSSVSAAVSPTPWWKESLTQPALSEVKTQAAGVQWIFDALESEVPPVTVAWSQSRDRVALGLVLLVLALSAIVNGPGVFLATEALIGLGGSALYSRRRFKATSEAQSLAAAQQKLRAAKVVVEEFERQSLEAKRKHEALVDQDRVAKLQYTSKRQDIETAMLKALQDVQENYASVMHRIASWWADADRRERETMRSVDADSGTKLRNAKAVVSAATQTMQREIAAALDADRSQFIERYLRSKSIRTANISVYCPEQVIYDLEARGVRNAFEIGIIARQKFRGVGPKRLQAFMSWRHQVESQAQSNAPQRLSPAVLQAIQLKYTNQIRTLESDQAVIQRRFEAECGAVAQQTEESRRQSAEAENQASLQSGSSQTAIRSRFSGQVNAIERSHVEASEKRLQAMKGAEEVFQGMRRRAYEVVWKEERAAREADRWRRVSYGQYLLSIMRVSRP